MLHFFVSLAFDAERVFETEIVSQQADLALYRKSESYYIWSKAAHLLTDSYSGLSLTSISPEAFSGNSFKCWLQFPINVSDNLVMATLSFHLLYRQPTYTKNFDP